MNASWGSIRQLRDWKGVLAVPNGQRGIDKGQLLMNDNNREHFGKKVYLEEHNKPNYMSSSIGFIYENSDGKSMVPLNRDISDNELKGYLAADKKRSGSIGHTKVETKPQNAPLTSDDMQKSFHDQQKVPANVRRFIAPSEGDSIFNADSDVIKGRLDAYKLK